jgi:glycosyltransferase involved in cell wall biosynthesis
VPWLCALPQPAKNQTTPAESIHHLLSPGMDAPARPETPSTLHGRATTRMKIAQVSAWSTPQAGGVGAYVARLLDLLKSSGHDLLLVHEDEGPAHIDGPDALETVRVGGLSRRARLPERVTADVLRRLEAFGPDVVHVHDVNNVDLLSAISPRYPVVRSAHNHAQHCPAGTRLIGADRHPCERPLGLPCLFNMTVQGCHPSRNPRVHLEMFRVSSGLNRFDRSLPTVCVASGYAHRQMVASGFLPEQLRILPYFTPIPDLAPAAAAPRTGDSVGHGAGRGAILFTGRIVPEKGLPALLHALQRVQRPWRLVVDGSGPSQPEAEEIATHLGIADSVQFQGWCPPAEHAQNYAAADIVVVPSVWPEPFGLVGIEAMSYAKPVVAFAIGGIVDWLEHGETGFLVSPGNVDEMAAKIERLLADPALARSLGERGRARVLQQYSPEAHLRDLTGIYEQTLSSWGGLSSRTRGSRNA